MTRSVILTSEPAPERAGRVEGRLSMTHALRRAWVGAARLFAGTFGAVTNGLTSSMPSRPSRPAAAADRNVDMLIGGQAVIEGVMMRSPRFFAVACRKPDQTIVVKTEPVEKSIIGKLKWLNKPFLRGTLALPKMAVPGVGWLAYVKDTEGNILGMMQRDPNAK